jgi:hypothetical protein
MQRMSVDLVKPDRLNVLRTGSKPLVQIAIVLSYSVEYNVCLGILPASARCFVVPGVVKYIFATTHSNYITATALDVHNCCQAVLKRGTDIFNHLIHPGSVRTGRDGETPSV